MNIKEKKGELVLLLITIIWGGTFLFTKNGLKSVSPFIFIILRFSIALLLSTTIFWKKIRTIDRATVHQGIILGLLFGGGFMLQTYALVYTTISKTAFITGLSAAFVPFAYRIIFKRHVTLWQWVGVIICIFGLGVFTNPNLTQFEFGDFLTLCSTFFWAFYVTFMDMFTKERNSFDETVQLVTMQFVGALPVTLLAFIFTDVKDLKLEVNSELIIALLYNGVIASFVLSLLQTNYQKLLSPVKASLIYSLEPVFASLIAVFAINEMLTGRELIGAAILFFGVLSTEFGKVVWEKLTNKSN